MLRMTTTKAYDYLNRLTGISSAAGGSNVAVFKNEHPTPTIALAVPGKKRFGAGTASRQRTLLMRRKARLRHTEHPSTMPASECCPGQPRAWLRELVSSQHAQFAFCQGCDCLSYVDFRIGRQRLGCQSNPSAAHGRQDIRCQTPYAAWDTAGRPEPNGQRISEMLGQRFDRKLQRRSVERPVGNRAEQVTAESKD
jgi:hypothetical protein